MKIMGSWVHLKVVKKGMTDGIGCLEDNYNIIEEKQYVQEE